MNTSARVPETQHKLSTSIGTKAKTLTKGIRTAMNSAGNKQLRRDRGSEDDGQHGETEELNLEDLATIPRVVGDDREASLELSESASQLRTSLHIQQQQQQQALITQDSPRGPEDWLGSNDTASATGISSQGRVSLTGGSENNIHSNATRPPLSPVSAALAGDGSLKHPMSAPQQLEGNLSPVPFSPQPTAKKSKFLRGKIKVSALKNFVGAGLDLGSSSASNHAPKQAPLDQERRQANTDAVAAQEEDFEDDDFATPQPAQGPGQKIARKMRKSIIGFTAFAKAGRNNAVLLEDDEDGTESTEHDDGGYMADDSHMEAKVKPLGADARSEDVVGKTETEEMIQKGLMHSATTTGNFFHDKEEAKARRREKHNQRMKRLDGSSNHANINSSQTSGGGQRRKTTSRPGRLDAEARERLKKHSEGRDFRNRHEHRRRRHQIASGLRDSDRGSEAAARLATSDQVEADLPELSPMTAKITLRTTPLRAPSGEPHVARRTADVQSGRKLKRKEDEELRERVRSRQSFVATNTPETSFSLLELLDKKEEDDMSFADDIAESVGPDHQEIAQVIAGNGSEPGLSLKDIFNPENDSKRTSSASGYLADTSNKASLNLSSTHLSLSTEAATPGYCQHVESAKSDDYLQLIIGNVPPTASTPEQEPESSVTAAEETSSLKPEKKLLRRGSKKALQDTGMDASEVRRKASHRTRGGEKKEGSTRRKQRGEKPSRRRPTSPRRRSDGTSERRRKATHRGGSRHASEPAIGTGGLEQEIATTQSDLANEGENIFDLLVPSGSTALDGESRSTIDATAKANDGFDGETSGSVLDVSFNLEEPALETHQGTAAAPTSEPSDQVKTSRRNEDKEHRRRPKSGREKRDRENRKSAKSSLTGTSKHGKEKSRSSARGRSDGSKKAHSSSRGRSEKPRRESLHHPGQRARRHSLDAKKRSSKTAADSEGNLSQDLPASELSKSLANIRW